MNLAHWLARAARAWPKKPALLSGCTLVADYRTFASDVRRLAGRLANECAIAPGDRVAIFAENSTRYLIALYGIWHAGAVAVPINVKLHPAEAAWILKHAQARLVFADCQNSFRLAPLLNGHNSSVISFGDDDNWPGEIETAIAEPVERRADDLAWLFYTSGTTGKPKAVMLSHRNLQAMAYAYFVDVDEVHCSDAALYAAPLSHGAGLYNIQHVLKGARHVIPPSGGFQPTEILDLAVKLRNVHMFAAPTMVRRLVDESKRAGRTADGVKTIVYGGGPMYLADIIEAVDVLGPRFCQIYGQGESPMTITALSRADISDRQHPRWRERLASVGKAQSCVEVRIADDNGCALPSGENGEILVRGAPVMAGYWRDVQATQQTLRDGWLWTGDLGSMDEDGYLTLRDRSKDVIISGGSNIYPREVEEILLTHPYVQEVSVIGQASDKWGEIVVACVVPVAGHTVSAEELDTLCLENIGRFKRPKTYHFVQDLPKNNYGKVLKTKLREQFTSKDRATP